MTNDKPLEQWSDEEKIATVKDIFSEITPHYDKMNHIMSARRDIAWRKFAINRIPQGARQVIDIATGTGDLALDTVQRRPEIHVTGLDFVPAMLELARAKCRDKDLTDKIDFVEGDAVHLQYEDDSFDCSTIAFGMRNIPDRLGAIREMRRVVRPGGKVIVLEMTFPRSLKLRRFFNWYLNNVIPALGVMITRNRKAYDYLSESIHNFLHPDQLSGLFQEAGLQKVQAFPLTLGITYLHEGIVT